MIARILRHGLWTAALVTVSVGGCECERHVGAPDDMQIDRPPIAEQDPDAPRPAVDFPAELHLDDPSFNKFVIRALEVCRLGDYDGFRQLFGTAYEPASEESFRKVWHNVRTVEVRQVVRAPQQVPHYYLYARVRLRAPDRKGQDLRDIWVMVFQEDDRWCLGAPSQAERQEEACEQLILPGELKS